MTFLKTAALSAIAGAVVASVVATNPAFAGGGRDFIVNIDGGMTSSDGGGMMQLLRASELDEQRKLYQQEYKQSQLYTAESARKEGLARSDR